ncbi:hypothetical protein [Kribbella sp. DT2]|uniref:hypothetical protein n=1 Tax=Kribbella sp. DT2 TaxID=3393427 RepID=UPI003CF33E75
MEPAEPRTDNDPYSISTRMARSTGAVTVPVSVGTVVEVVDDLAHVIDEPRLVSLSAERAEFTRKRNAWTWGLRITLSFRALGPERTLIRADCRPKLPTVLWDGGQGATELAMMLGLIDQGISSER